MNQLYLILRIIIICGLVFLTAGLGLAWQRAGLTNGTVTEGTVIELKPHYAESIDNSYVKQKYLIYLPVIQYEMQQKQLTYTSPNGSSPPAYKVGDRVKLLYRQDNPEDILIHSFLEIWLLPLILIILGIVMVMVYAVVMRLVLKK